MIEISVTKFSDNSICESGVVHLNRDVKWGLTLQVWQEWDIIDSNIFLNFLSVFLAIDLGRGYFIDHFQEIFQLFEVIIQVMQDCLLIREDSECQKIYEVFCQVQDTKLLIFNLFNSLPSQITEIQLSSETIHYEKVKVAYVVIWVFTLCEFLFLFY